MLKGACYYHENKEYIQGKYLIQESWSVEEKSKNYYFRGFCLWTNVLEVNKKRTDFCKKKMFTKWHRDKIL